MWEEDCEETIALWEVRNSQEMSSAELAEGFDMQLKMISAAFATGDAAKIDRVINHIAIIRRMRKLGIFDLRGSNKNHSEE